MVVVMIEVIRMDGVGDVFHMKLTPTGEAGSSLIAEEPLNLMRIRALSSF